MHIQGIKNAASFDLADHFRKPKQALNKEGVPRKVGVELEFAGINDEVAACAIKSVLGGTVEKTAPHSSRVNGSELGDIEIMLDIQHAHPADDAEPPLLEDWREVFGSVVTPIVPQELVTEPLPIDRLHLLDDVVSVLGEVGATGTHDSLAYAFGLHLNPELANESSTYLLQVIRSMILLDDEVRTVIEPDVSRRVLRWAKSYSEAYELCVLDPDYDPDMETLIKDYVALNGGRSHHLDMLPAFRHIDNETVTKLLGDKHSSARPTFHYRLPNSRVGAAGWSIKEDWNVWVEIEDFAAEIGREVLHRWHRANATW